jgi:hypothetical protein
MTRAVLVTGFGALALVDPGLSELKNFAPTIILVMVAAYVTLRFTPHWKEVRLRTLEVREKEVVAQVEIAVATAKLGEVVREVAVEQRQATEVIQVAQRVNVNSAEKLTHAVNEMAHMVEDLGSRMDKVEANAAAAAANRG